MLLQAGMVEPKSLSGSDSCKQVRRTPAQKSKRLIASVSNCRVLFSWSYFSGPNDHVKTLTLRPPARSRGIFDSGPAAGRRA